MTIKAIETHYKGYRFRSRLEARWAVFFDSLPLRYEYEPEGYELGGGARYLPDFYLPDIDTYIEIKPARGQGHPTEDKHHTFGDHRRLVVIAGDPLDYKAFLCDGGWDDNYEWCICPSCGSVNIQFSGMYERNAHTNGCSGTGDLDLTSWVLDRAGKNARSARFEFSETPA